MRLRACIGLILLAAAGCSQLPCLVRIDIDGRMVEIRQRGLGREVLQGGWSTSPACEGGAAVDLGNLDRSVVELRRVRPDEIEVARAPGGVLRLFRCAA